MQVQNSFSLSRAARMVCIAALLSYQSFQASLPQGGQNLWHVTAAIGTDVDTILQCSVGTFTVIAALIEDLNNTSTATGSSSPCMATQLSQTNVINGGILLTTTGANYCLSQNITGSIIISAADIDLDLNFHSLLGTIDIVGTSTNVIIENGRVKPLSPVSSADAAHAAITIASSVDKALIKNCYVVCADSTGLNGRTAIQNSSTNTIINGCFIQAGSGTIGGDGISNTGFNLQATENSIVLSISTGATRGNGIVQQGSDGMFIDNIITGTTGIGITTSSGSNLNIIKNCIASNCYAGFSMLTTGTVNILDCIAQFCVTTGFDCSGSTGRGKIKQCQALQNTGCGFNDTPASVYRYLSNTAEGNGATPGNTINDTNYCFVTGTATGGVTPPYYQFLPNNTGAALPNLSIYNNITVQ